MVLALTSSLTRCRRFMVVSDNGSLMTICSCHDLFNSFRQDPRIKLWIIRSLLAEFINVRYASRGHSTTDWKSVFRFSGKLLRHNAAFPVGKLRNSWLLHKKSIFNQLSCEVTIGWQDHLTVAYEMTRGNVWDEATNNLAILAVSARNPVQLYRIAID